MPSFHQIGCDKEKLPRFFDPANDRNRTPVGRSPDDFVARSARVTGESPSHPPLGYSHLDVPEGQVVVGHFFKKVREGEFILPIANLLSDDVDKGQGLSSILIQADHMNSVDRTIFSRS